MSVPTRVAERLTFALKRFQPILLAAKSRDVNESNTSMIVTDMMADMFGYDKYSEVTREHAIRGTYCDIATQVDGKLQMIIEVKAIGLDLKDSHVKQAVDYAANKGVEWVALTNGNLWKVFRVMFTQPINAEPVLEMDILLLNPREQGNLENLYLLTKESIIKSGLYAFHDQLQATNKFLLSAVILNDPVLESIRREIRRLSPDTRIQIEDPRATIKQDVLKREVIEGEKAEAARKKVQKASGKLLRAKTKKEKEETSELKEPPISPADQGDISN